MTSDSATCARSPLLPVEQPSIRGEDDCDDARSISSWKNIFAVAPAAGAPPPALGVNFMKATQHTITVEFTLATVHGTPWKDSHGEGRAILTLGQDLLQRGLGAVVWDCVSVNNSAVTSCVLHLYHTSSNTSPWNTPTANSHFLSHV